MLNKKVEEKICVSKELLYISLYSFFVVSSIVFMTSVKSLILFVVCFYLGSIIIYIGYKNRKYENIDKWIEIDARVISAKVIKCVCFSAFRVRQNINEVYRPEITYRYIYNNEEFISNQYAISLDDVDCNFSYTQQEAQKIVNDIKRNKTIKIFVNQDTGESVISLNAAKGYGIPYIGMTIAGSMFLLLVYKIYYYI